MNDDIEGQVIERAAAMLDELAAQFSRKADAAHRRKQYERYEDYDSRADLVAFCAGRVRQLDRTHGQTP